MYYAIKKADITSFRKEFFLKSLDFLDLVFDIKFKEEVYFIYEQLMKANAYR